MTKTKTLKFAVKFDLKLCGKNRTKDNLTDWTYSDYNLTSYLISTDLILGGLSLRNRVNFVRLVLAKSARYKYVFNINHKRWLFWSRFHDCVTFPVTGGREDLGTRLRKVCFGAHKEMASGFLLFSKWRFISCREGKTKKFVIHVFNLNLSWPCDFYVVNRVKKMRPETIFSLFLALFCLLWSSKIHPLPTESKNEKGKEEKERGRRRKMGQGCTEPPFLRSPSSTLHTKSRLRHGGTRYNLVHDNV